MSTPDSQEKLKEEAKAISAKLEELVRDTDPKTRMVRTVCIYAGMLTETLLEYEEPDVVMEQAFHRIADLLQTDPVEEFDQDNLMPLATAIDHDTELGRHLARGVARRLPKGLDDIHEITIALIINDFPLREKEGYGRDVLLRLLVETTIAALTYEMATQDFCDLLIEEFMAEGRSPSEAILALSAVTGHYLAQAEAVMSLPEGVDADITNVMIRESIRHGTPGSRQWGTLAASNDTQGNNVSEYLDELKPQVEEFFVLIGLEDPLGRVVAVAKAVGRMVAVITIEDVGQIHPSIAKSLAKTGMILGSKYKEQAATA